MTVKQPVIGLIPARKGSKGIIGKNMQLVLGVPLIDFSIRAAKMSSYISQVFVSSDDQNILNHAGSLGCETLLRPSQFSDDFASANSVIKHFFDQMHPELRSLNPIVVYLQPTSPLRTSIHIDEAIEAMVSEGRPCTISICANEVSPFKSFTINNQGRLQALFSEEMTNKRRQDLESTFVANGALYIFSMAAFVKKNRIPSDGAVPYIMDKADSLDIDDKEDLAALEKAIVSQADKD